MKLRTLILGALISLTSIGFAQQPIKYGVKAGVTLANYDAKAAMIHINTSNLTSFYVAGFMEYQFPNTSIYFQPGVLVQGKGGVLSASIDDGVDGYTVEVSERPYWIEVPVNFVNKTYLGNETSLLLGVGPYVAFGVGGDYKVNTSGGFLDWVPTLRPDLEFGSNGNLKRVDAGLNFTGGIEFTNGLSVQAGFGLGLVDVGGNKLFGSNISKLDQKNRVWSFGLAKTF